MSRAINTSRCSKFFEDGSSYEGELLNYKFHGNGTYIFANGDKYRAVGMMVKSMAMVYIPLQMEIDTMGNG